MSASLLAVDGLTRTFGSLVVLSKLDLAVEAGQIHAIIGPNGAGKTTFFNLVTGALGADAGHISFDGRTIDVAGATVTLELEGAEIATIVPDWRDELLALITNPNVAYILLMLGIYGLILEFYNPGTGVPGVTGVICLLLAAYALQMLPVSYAGLALLLFGVALMVAEIVTPTVGVLGVGGVIAFVAGSIILFDSDLPGYRVSIPIIAAAAVASAAVFLLGIGSAMRARRLRVATGREAMIGARAVALEDFAERGNVRAFSENWLAEAPHPVRKGDQLRVTGVEGLVLRVEADTQEHVAEES